MLNFIYRLGRCFMSRGWVVGLLLIFATASTGTVGFLNENELSKKNFTPADSAYKAIGLLALQLDMQPSPGNWQLELARWLGMFFFASALLTFAIRLSRESAHRRFVKLFAKDHVIVAGLGTSGVRLVEALRLRGRTVVVLDSDRAHVSIEQCRRAGAIVLFGEPSDTATLRAANLPKAAVLLALFAEERECVRVVTSAHEILHPEKASPKKPPVRCVLRLTEPGLLDVIRRHKIKTDPIDRIQLEILNSHEIAATTMVREAKAHCRSLRKIMVLGLGTHHRLGEMVVIRAAKDHLILNDGKVDEKLTIDVFDKHGQEWIDTVRSRYPFLDRVCTIQPHHCWARKIGGTGIDHDYDAAFVCIPDEGHATAQAVMLRREVMTEGQPIMVRVNDSHSGYGWLITTSESGWGYNLHAVGLEDPLFDPDTATQPELELRAQTIHHDYRATKRLELSLAKLEEERQKIREAEANRPWVILENPDRQQNRDLAEKYVEYLKLVEGEKKRSYQIVFAPDHFWNDSAKLATLELDECIALERIEHTRWLTRKMLPGESFEEARQRTGNDFIRPYEQLTDSQKEYNRKFVREIPLILALADYTIVAENPETGAHA